MNTTIIACNKGAAQVVDENGRFLCKVSDGINVKRGDTIQIDSIGLEQTGIGSDVIEIPENFGLDKNKKVIPYSPNVCSMKAAYYIHHNYQNTLRMPFHYQSIPPGGGAPDVAPGILAPIEGAGQFRGYLTCATGIPQFDAAQMSAYFKSANSDRTMDGKRFYLFAPNEGGFPNENDGDYNLMESRIPISVKTGYDSPANIATRITTELHRTDYCPYTINQTTNTSPEYAPYLPVAHTHLDYIYYGDTKDLANEQVALTITSGEKINTTNYTGTMLTTSCNLTGGTLSNPLFALDAQHRMYGHNFASANPFLWVYGSKLLNDLTTAKDNTLVAAAEPGTIYNVFDEDTDGVNVNWGNGYTVCTNILYNEANVRLIAEFVHSQKQLSADSNNAPKLTTPDLDTPTGKALFNSPISFGRTNDSVVGGITPLTHASCAVPLKTEHCFMHTYFDRVSWKAKELGADAVINDMVVLEGGHNEPASSLSGMSYTEIAELVDCNICAVNDEDGLGNPLIGLVFNVNEFIPAVAKGNYCLVDLSFFNPLNPCVMLMNPILNRLGVDFPTSEVGDFGNLLQIGAPNATMLFQDNGHFGLEHLHYPVFTGNAANAGAGGVSVNATPDVECVKLNVIPEFFQTTGDAFDLNLIHTQAGIGITGLEIFNKETNTYEECNADTYKYHLFNRLGFTFNGIMNNKGRPEVDLNTTYYQRYDTPTLYAGLFPYPLTTNALLDSSTALGLSRTAGLGGGTVNLPMYNLTYTNSNNNVAISTQSAVLEAKNLATKLDFPFHLIWTDFVPQIPFHSQNTGRKDNIMAVVGRGYTNGDFVYGYTQSYSYVARQDFTLTSVKTAILKPDLTPADHIGDGSTIVYKITSPIESFENPTAHISSV